MDVVCAINISAHAPPKELQVNNVGRKLVTFPENIWGDYFLKISPNEEKLDSWRGRAKEIKEKVLDMLRRAKGAEQVHLIDALCHLGVSYQFEMEIGKALKNMINTYTDDSSKDDLHTLALRFRLLRQNGFHASSHAFNKFKDARGGFKEHLAFDVMGLLSLYEASYAGTVEDLILDEALAFSRNHLKAALPGLDSLLAKRVSHSLELPLNKRIERLEAREFISLCEEESSNMINKELLEFAKLDYNILQALHQWELKEITKWWKKLDLVGKMTFARDRISETYFYVSGLFFEPQYSRGRIMGTKLLAICSVVDDEYDVYGTLDELRVFTDAICRYDVAAIETLPEYTKPLYEAIFHTLKEFEEELAPEGNAHRVQYIAEEMKNLCKSYLQETTWLHEKYIPTFEEYLVVSEISSTYGVIYTACIAGCGDIATNEVFEWFKGCPKLFKDSARVGRIADDIMTCKFEQSRGHCASAVECYMEELQCSWEVAVERLGEVLGRAWKDMNKAFMRPIPFPTEVLKPIVNMARIAEIVYQYEDGYTFSGGKTKERISVLYKDPIPI